MRRALRITRQHFLYPLLDNGYFGHVHQGNGDHIAVDGGIV